MKSQHQTNKKSVVLICMKSKTLALVAAIVLMMAAPAFSQNKPAVELEGAIAKEQVDGDIKAAIASYQKISADTAAPRDVRAKALLRLASSHEKLGQPSLQVYQQIVRDFSDQTGPSTQARARLAALAPPQATAAATPRDFKLERLTANTTELPIQMAAISSDGKLVAYSDPLGVHIQSMATGETRLLPGTKDHVLVRWTPDGQAVQTRMQGAAGGAVARRVVPLNGDAQFPAPESLTGYLISPDRTHRASASDDRLRISILDANGENSREVWNTSPKCILDQFPWSPNGKAIAVTCTKSDDTGVASRLEVIDIARGVRNVVVSEEKNLWIRSIVWASPNRIVASIDELARGVNQRNSNLWEVSLNPDGTPVTGSLRKLTAWTDFPIRNRSLTTDGKNLVFIRSFAQRDVYVAPLEAGGTQMGTPRRFTLDLGDDYPTGWTRDSKSVLITSDRTGMQGIYRQDLDRQTAERIVEMPGHQLLARPTPDGSSVLFMGWDPAKGQHSQLMLVPIAGGAPVLVPNSEKVGSNYRCGMVGTCMIAERQGGEYIISELDFAKGRGREIYRETHADHLDVSPDGKWISEASGRGATAKVVLRSFTTGTVEREIALPGAATLMGMDWAPDSKGFFWGDRSATHLRVMYSDLSGKASVLWSQPAGTLSSIWGIPSPDGKHLALVLLTDDSNVYAIKNF